MTAPTHSLSVRPELLPAPPDWVLRLRVGSASTQQVALPRLTPGYRADKDLPGRGPLTPLEVRVSARDVNMAALRMRVELARNHILDHVLTQRADGAIVGHGKFHSLSEVAKTSILKKGSPPLNHSPRSWSPRSQFSARKQEQAV